MKIMRKYLGSLYKRWDRLFSHPWGVYARKGAYLLLDKSSMMDEGLIKFKHYEDDLLARARKVIEKNQLDVLVDIGANLGYYSVQLGKLEAIRQIISFEPIRKLYVQTSANVLINGLLPKWSGFNLALSDTEDERDIHYNPFYMGVSSLNSEWTDRFDHTETVQTKTFDSLSVGFSGRFFIKIDVEGWEVNVIKGMLDFLRSQPVFLQLEALEDSHKQVCELLEPLGYRFLESPALNDHYYTNIEDLG